eukprot:TRINITY_DN215_c0_g1_i1.p1 TRINITY_DN215_c0_g1~~TRINITY_DN215_c0_g1_i1.p1  ORF type:complete len:181 (-),score=68.62 TRINITY_DN215_c0_g1_i1:214-711(-)
MSLLRFSFCLFVLVSLSQACPFLEGQMGDAGSPEEFQEADKRSTSYLFEARDLLKNWKNEADADLSRKAERAFEICKRANELITKFYYHGVSFRKSQALACLRGSLGITETLSAKGDKERARLLLTSSLEDIQSLTSAIEDDVGMRDLIGPLSKAFLTRLEQLKK